LFINASVYKTLSLPSRIEMKRSVQREFCQINNLAVCLHAAEAWALPLASGVNGKTGCFMHVGKDE
jgi:hypothetical protein